MNTANMPVTIVLPMKGLWARIAEVIAAFAMLAAVFMSFQASLCHHFPTHVARNPFVLGGPYPGRSLSWEKAVSRMKGL